MDVIQTGVLWLLIAGAVVYCGACVVAFTGLMKKVITVGDFTPTVAIIVPARNEEYGIVMLLDDLARQEYPRDRLHIIVVDDRSEDGTADAVRRFMTGDSHSPRIELRTTAMTRSPYSHKKRAVHEGILSSDSEIIMTTDADCRVPRGWVRGMAKHFTDGVDLVAGMVVVEGSGFTGRLEALESTGIQYMAAGLMNAGFPITCNGANLAYRRAAFDHVGGFEGVGDIVSGDDDLLMQKIARSGSGVVFVAGRETAVRTEAAESTRAFFDQRARWASKIWSYPSVAARALLTVFFAFFAGMAAWLTAAIFGVAAFGPLAAVFALKATGDLLLTGYGAVHIGKPELLPAFPFAECLHIPYILGVVVKGLFGTFEWRGRRAGAVSVECGDNR